MASFLVSEALRDLRRAGKVAVSAILLIVIATVIIIDMLTEALRHRLIGLMEKP